MVAPLVAAQFLASPEGQKVAKSGIKVASVIFLFIVIAIICIVIFWYTTGFSLFGKVLKPLKQALDVKTLVCPKGQTLKGLLCYENCKEDETSDGTHGCYRKAPKGWPGKHTVAHLQHNTKYSPSKGIPSVCDKPSDTKHDGMCYEIKDNETYSSPGLVKLKNCPATSKRSDGVHCWTRESDSWGRDHTSGGSKKQCEGDYGEGLCEKAGAIWYPKCIREAKWWASNIIIKDKCMQLKEHNLDNGQPLELWDCFGYGRKPKHRKQRIYYDVDSKEIRYGQGTKAKCLDVKAGETAKIWDCNKSNSQKFDYNLSEGKFKLANDNTMCLQLVGGKSDKGTRFELGKCNSSDTQVFNDNPVHEYINMGLTCLRNPVTALKLISRMGYAPKKCPAGQHKKGALCYANCPEGYERTDGNIENCTTKCPKDFRNIGLGGCERPRRNVSGKGLTIVGICPESHPLRTGDLCYKHQKDMK